MFDFYKIGEPYKTIVKQCLRCPIYHNSEQALEILPARPAVGTLVGSLPLKAPPPWAPQPP